MTRALVRVTLPGILVGSMLLFPGPGEGAAQSVLERTPNLSGGWVGAPGRLHFNFLHRFDAGGPPTRKVSSAPTFLLAYGIGGYGLLGVHYTTNSVLVPGHPNEWEVLGRVSPLTTTVGAPVDLGLTAAYNEAAESFDAEAAVGVPFGPVKALAAARFFSDAFGRGESRWALGGGVRVRFHEHLAVAGDVVSLMGEASDEVLEAGPPEEDYGWGAAVQIAIPYTPHTLSLQAANTNSATLQGSSVKAGGTRFGFEFTIPITPARYLGGGQAAGAAGPDARTVGEAELVASDTVRISMTEFEYSQPRIAVRPGTYVLWVNEGEVVHSSTSDTGLWDSRLLAPGESYGRVFTEAGAHPYHCTPHPFMTGVVEVRPGGDR